LNAKGYVNLLRDHIYKEDNVLYPMADQNLSDNAQEELTKEFDRIEKEIIGEGKHEVYHELLKNLKSIYLN
jgi:hemerythrin-like domain-containing protein